MQSIDCDMLQHDKKKKKKGNRIEKEDTAEDTVHLLSFHSSVVIIYRDLIFWSFT